LLDHDVNAAACVMTAGEVIEQGLPADRIASVTVRKGTPLEGSNEAQLRAAMEMIAPNVEGGAR
jgi:hypothetical protein